MSAMVALAATPAHAGALIRLTPTGWAPDAYQQAGMPLDPAILGTDGFRLTFWGNSGETLVNPVMLVLALPDPYTTAPALTVGTTSGFANVAVDLGDSTNRYGGTWNTTTGSAGTFSGADKGSVYDKIGFTPQGSPSESYANWNPASGVTSWNLFVYAITFNPTMKQGDYVEFTTSLPIASFVVGYGCESLTSGGLCGTGSGNQSTPFTFAGMAVPEPATVTLMLSGLGMALARARRRRA